MIPPRDTAFLILNPMLAPRTISLSKAKSKTLEHQVPPTLAFPVLVSSYLLREQDSNPPFRCCQLFTWPMTQTIAFPPTLHFVLQNEIPLLTAIAGAILPAQEQSLSHLK